MGKEILTFEDTEIEKLKFYHHKTAILLKNVETEKVLISIKISLCEKNTSTLLVTCTMILKLSHYI